MPKVDLRRVWPDYSARRGRFDLLEIPQRRHLALDGSGDPNTAALYRDSVQSLYPMAYGVKAIAKAAGRDHVVMPLEALWWAPDMAVFTTDRDKDQWSWTVMIALPDWVTAEQVESARERVSASGRAPRVDEVRLEIHTEGWVVQTLHIGPYDAEGPVLQTMHEEVIPAHGLQPTGHHHEIYLGDPRRAAPERLRTILRQPVG